jgi:hypothetical protein
MIKAEILIVKTVGQPRIKKTNGRGKSAFK